MAPKKRDLSDAECHLLLQTTRKSLEKTFKSRGFAPVLPQLSVRALRGGGGYELGGHERYWDDKFKAQEEARQRSIIEEEKARLLAEHAAILQQHHPKANSQYMGGFQR